MNRQSLETPAAAPAREAFRQRIDDARHKIVEQGISVQSRCSSICAIEYLKSHDVDAEVIERVLLHPELRRKTPH